MDADRKSTGGKSNTPYMARTGSSPTRRTKIFFGPHPLARVPRRAGISAGLSPVVAPGAAHPRPWPALTTPAGATLPGAAQQDAPGASGLPSRKPVRPECWNLRLGRHFQQRDIRLAKQRFQAEQIIGKPREAEVADLEGSDDRPGGQEAGGHPADVRSLAPGVRRAADRPAHGAGRASRRMRAIQACHFIRRQTRPENGRVAADSPAFWSVKESVLLRSGLRPARVVTMLVRAALSSMPRPGQGVCPGRPRRKRCGDRSTIRCRKAPPNRSC